MSDNNTDHDAALVQPPGVRASDAERESALRTLSAHYADGRLVRAEFDQRADAALTARTREELLALFTDLPGPRPVPSPVDEQTRAAHRSSITDTVVNRPRARPPVSWNAPLLLVPVLLAFAVLAAVHGAPPFPLVVIAFILMRRHRRWNRWNREARPWI